jgi:hypothetical protein
MNDLILICETCGFPITGNTGSLYVRTAELVAYREELQVWRAASSSRDGLISGAELMLLPLPVHWRTGHDKCRTDHDEEAYEIDAPLFTSWASLAKWTAHLMGKNWLPSTDWAHLLREVSGEASVRRVRVGAREAA